MKNRIKKISLLFLTFLCVIFASAFVGCKTEDLSSLYSLSKPYLTEYECTQATLAGKDMLHLFKYVQVEFKEDGVFTVRAKPKIGVLYKKDGKYTFNEDTKIFSAKLNVLGKNYSKSFKLQKGAFTVSVNYSGKQLVMKFVAR